MMMNYSAREFTQHATTVTGEQLPTAVSELLPTWV